MNRGWIYRISANLRGEKNGQGRTGRPRLSSWPLRRRSGRFPHVALSSAQADDIIAPSVSQDTTDKPKTGLSRSGQTIRGGYKP